MCETFLNRSLLAVAILCGIGSGQELAHGGQTHYFAIMGEVARPGVFELDSASTQLLDLVKLAGGPTTMASGNVRIIRGGQACKPTSLNPGLNHVLSANDMVILDARPSRSKRQFDKAWPDETAGEVLKGGGPLPPDSTVQLGLINLISRPVVLDVTSEQAILGTVLSLLRQPGRDIRVVTILEPVGGIVSVACDHGADISLAAGSVLVFDPTTVDANVLPQLPATVPPQTNAAPPAPKAQPPKESIPLALTRLRAASVAPAILPASPEELIGELPESRVAAKTLAPPKPSDQVAQAQRATAHTPGWLSASKWLVLVGVLGISAIALSRSRLRRQNRTEDSEGVPPASEETMTLKSLISNSLPVIEEALPFPKKSEIFGRPRLDSPYRIDIAHVLSGPHYTVQPAPPAATPAPVPHSADGELRQSADDAPARRIRVDRAHPRSSPGALDRALATFEEGRS